MFARESCQGDSKLGHSARLLTLLASSLWGFTMWMRLAILLRLDVIEITKENAQMKSDNAGRKNTPVDHMQVSEKSDSRM